MVEPERRSPAHKGKKRWWMSFRHFGNRRLNNSSRVGPVLRRVWGLGKWLFLKARRRLFALLGAPAGTYLAAAIVDKVVWVPVQRIRYCSLRGFNIRWFKGSVMGGDWDRLEKRFDELDIFVALEQVCLHGKDWSDTVYYQRNIEMINEGYIRQGCKNQEELDRKCRERELLFQTIRDEGYKPQCELASAQQSGFGLRDEAEVIVSIGRHGDLLFSDGAHRLAIAKLLGIQEIPVVVAVRHSEWVAFRQKLQRYAREAGGLTHLPLTHPDLEDIPVFNGQEDRFRMIKANMLAPGGRLLDLGANLGYFCHRFEAQGFDCCALEESPERYHLLVKLKRAENKEFLTSSDSALDCCEIRDTPFAVTLALKALHHFVESEEQHSKLVDLLGHLETEEMFFEPSGSGQPEMQGEYRSYGPDEFVEFLLANSRLTNAECIGTTEDMTPLFRLY